MRKRQAMRKLTFKEYIDSKKQLRAAIEKNPVITKTYKVNKYCKLPVVENNTRRMLSLTPKTIMIVEWLYEDCDCEPTATSFRFEDLREVESLEDFNSDWKPEKFNKWIQTNTVEE